MANLTEAILATVAGLSDAAAAAQLSAPIYTPKRDRITLTTIGGAWGLARGAAFRAWLVGASAQQTQLGYVAAAVLDLLKGPGFDAFHADVPGTIQMLVAAGGCTEAEARAALYDVSYMAGGVVTAEEVATARAAIVRATAYAAARRFVADRYNAVIATIDAAAVAGEPAPSNAELLAAMGADE
jgi:hypothetical protein